MNYGYTVLEERKQPTQFGHRYLEKQVEYTGSYPELLQEPEFILEDVLTGKTMEFDLAANIINYIGCAKVSVYRAIKSGKVFKNKYRIYKK